MHLPSEIFWLLLFNSFWVWMNCIGLRKVLSIDLGWHSMKTFSFVQQLLCDCWHSRVWKWWFLSVQTEFLSVSASRTRVADEDEGEWKPCPNRIWIPAATPPPIESSESRESSEELLESGGTSFSSFFIDPTLFLSTFLSLVPLHSISYFSRCETC